MRLGISYRDIDLQGDSVETYAPAGDRDRIEQALVAADVIADCGSAIQGANRAV